MIILFLEDLLHWNEEEEVLDAEYEPFRDQLSLAGLSEEELRKMDPDDRVAALERANLAPYNVPASPQPEVVCHYHGYSQRKAGASRRWHYFRGECQMRSSADRLLPGRAGNVSRVSHAQSPLADHCAGRQRGRGKAQIPAGYEL